MTATDELRRMLDERGVEYREHRYSGQSVTTIWRAGCEFHYRENRHGETRMHADGLTPEQAVETTLGGGLQAENERLQRQGERLFDKTLELATENAKLRELVRDSASLLDATCDTYYEDDYHAIIDRMRELGVEV